MEQQSYQIENLSKVSDWIELVANWHYHEWVKRQPSTSKSSEEDAITEKLRRQNNLSQHLGDTAIPSTYILHDCRRPLGSVSLVNYQFGKSVSNSSIWLTNLYVVKELRRRGLGAVYLHTQ